MLLKKIITKKFFLTNKGLYICTVAMKQQPNTISYDDFRNIKIKINR